MALLVHHVVDISVCPLLHGSITTDLCSSVLTVGLFHRAAKGTHYLKPEYRQADGCGSGRNVETGGCGPGAGPYRMSVRFPK